MQYEKRYYREAHWRFKCYFKTNYIHTKCLNFLTSCTCPDVEKWPAVVGSNFALLVELLLLVVEVVVDVHVMEGKILDGLFDFVTVIVEFVSANVDGFFEADVESDLPTRSVKSSANRRDEFDMALRASEILGFGRNILQGPGASTAGPAPVGPAADTKCGGRLNRLAGPILCC
uniref:Uncharacterized protein n=1 Tax=Glossina pallidipes TaxID=7398 RepID=A0A1A9ZBF4_GLOPL